MEFTEQEYYNFCDKLDRLPAGTVVATSEDMNRQIIAYGADSVEGAYINHVGGEFRGTHEGISEMTVMQITGGKLPA